jgi:hypothetical protein
MKPNQLELIQEANRRGILPADKKPLYDEAVRRGLIKDQSQPEMSMGEAAFTTATNPLGFGDEIKAGISAGVAKLFGGAATQNIDIGDLYREARTSERAKLEKARQDRPLTSFAGQVFSDVGIAGKALGAAGLAGQGFGTAVKGGALLGATSALGETEDLTNIPQTLEDVAKGAVAGGVVGGAVQQAIPVAQSAVGAISQAPKKLLQKITGIDPKAVKTFQDLGIDPTLADVSKSAGLQNFIKDIPVAGKPITEALQKQVNDISGQIQGVTKSQGGTYTEAGQQLKSGAENIKDKFSKTSGKLYNKVSELVPPDTPVSINNTLNAIKSRKVQIRKEVSDDDTAGYVKYIEKIEKDLAAPLKEGELGRDVSYDSLAALRSEVGLSLSGNLKPVERKALGDIYRGITQDITNTLQKADLGKVGNRSAMKEWQKANRYHRVNSRFIEENIQPLLDKGTPEEVYKYATSQSKLGGTKISQIMRSLNEPQKDFVRSTLVRDMGLAQKGAQSAEGNVFNPQKFMAEYSVLKKNGTEKAVFTPEQVTAYNRLNKVVELTKNTEQAGKSNQMLQMVGLGSIGFSSGVVSLIPAIGGGRIAANLMTNPKFINWLAVTAQTTPKELPKQLNRLSAITAANPEIREDVLNFVANFGASNANAEEPNMSEEQIRRQLIQQHQQYPLLSDGQQINPQEINAQTKQIKQRYYKD